MLLFKGEIFLHVHIVFQECTINLIVNKNKKQVQAIELFHFLLFKST